MATIYGATPGSGSGNLHATPDVAGLQAYQSKSGTFPSTMKLFPTVTSIATWNGLSANAQAMLANNGGHPIMFIIPLGGTAPTSTALVTFLRSLSAGQKICFCWESEAENAALSGSAFLSGIHTLSSNLNSALATCASGGSPNPGSFYTRANFPVTISAFMAYYAQNAGNLTALQAYIPPTADCDIYGADLYHHGPGDNTNVVCTQDPRYKQFLAGVAAKVGANQTYGFPEYGIDGAKFTDSARAALLKADHDAMASVGQGLALWNYWFEVGNSGQQYLFQLPSAMATQWQSYNSTTAPPPPPPPTITSFTPTSGPVGTAVTVTGTGFSGASSVKIGTLSVTGYTVGSSTSLRFTIPTGAVSGTISITTPNGTATSGGTLTVTTPSNPPTITSVSPLTAQIGDTITVTGTNLASATSVRLGGSSGVTVTPLTDTSTQITFAVPNGSAGGPVWVQTSNGAVTSSQSIALTQPPPPSGFSITSLPQGVFSRTATMQIPGRPMWTTDAQAAQVANECVVITGNWGMPRLNVIMQTNPRIGVCAYCKSIQNPAGTSDYDAAGTKYPNKWYVHMKDGTKAKQTGSFVNWLMETGQWAETQVSATQTGPLSNTSITASDWSHHHILDAIAKAVKENALAAQAGTKPIRGLFLDTMGVFSANATTGFWTSTTNPGWNPHTNTAYTKPLFDTMAYYMGDVARNPAVNSGNLWVIGNGLRVTDGTDSTGQKISAHVDMAMSEGWVATGPTPPTRSASAYEGLLQLAINCQADGAVAQLYEWGQTADTAAVSTQRRRFAACSYFIAHRGKATFEFSKTKTTAPWLETGDDPDLYALNAGTPLSGQSPTSAHGHQVPVGTGNGTSATAGLYRRYFTAATILANPTGGAITYQADQNYTLLLRPDQSTPVSYNQGDTINVPPTSGMILIPAAAPSGTAASNVDHPYLLGSPVEGQFVTRDVGNWAGDDPITYTDQWRQSSSSGGPWTPISGAVQPSFSIPFSVTGGGGTATVASDTFTRSVAGSGGGFPTSGCLWGEYTDASNTGTSKPTQTTIQAREATMGRPFDLCHFFAGSNPNSSTSPITTGAVQWALTNKPVVLLTTSFGWGQSTFPGYSSVTSGAQDSTIDAWSSALRDLQALGGTVIFRQFQEFNGNWFNYGTGASGYNPGFVNMWKYIVDRYIANGVDIHGKVLMCWCPNTETNLSITSTTTDNGYPGDSYVDVIGIDGYNKDSANTGAGASFQSLFSTIYGRYSAKNKPFVMCETGCVDHKANQRANWFTAATNYIKGGTVPLIKGFCYWDAVGTATDKITTHLFEYRVDHSDPVNATSSAASLAAYKAMGNDPYFTLSGWGSATAGGVWTIQQGTTTDLAVTSGRGTVSHAAGNTGKQATLAGAYADIDCYLDVNIPHAAAGGPLHASLMVRWQDTDNFLDLNCIFNTTAGAAVTPRKVVAGVATSLGTAKSFTTYSTSDNVHLRLKAAGSQIQGKAWVGSDPEPSTWDWTTTDSAITAAGLIGARSFRSTANTNPSPQTRFDNLLAQTTTGTTVTSTFVGQYLSDLVTGTNATGGATVASSAFGPVTAGAPSEPIWTTLPSLSGPPVEGQQVIGRSGIVEGNPVPTFTDQFQTSPDGAEGTWTDRGGDSTSYTPPSGFAGSWLRFRVTASNAAGTTVAYSPRSLITSVGVTPSFATRPSITGDPIIGQTLIGDHGVASGAPQPTITQRWESSADNGASWVDAQDTDLSYLLTDSDAGALIRLTATATNANGQAAASSDPIGPIQFPNTGGSGTFTLGVTLE